MTVEVCKCRSRRPTYRTNVLTDFPRLDSTSGCTILDYRHLASWGWSREKPI